MRKTLIPILILAFCIPAAAQQADTVTARITRQWTLSDDYTLEIPAPIDTSFSLCHRFKLTDKFSPFNAYPGNYGLPLYQINFFDRITDPDKFLYRYYYPFMHLPDKPVFMNTQVPFTEMAYENAGPRELSEQVFRVRHSQNASRFLNFGIIYDVVYSLGQYSYQRTDDKNFNYYSSYTGDKYKFYLSGGINNLTFSENGGISDRAQLGEFETRDIQVRLGSLNEASSSIRNRNLLLIQKYTLGKTGTIAADTSGGGKQGRKTGLSGTFSHILIWDKTRSSYADNYPGAGFYDTSYISTAKTFDSLSARVLKNTIRFDFSTDETRKFRLGGGAGIRNELFRYSQIIPSEASPPSDTASWNKYNNLIVGRLFNNIGSKLSWEASGELYFMGYRAGDFDLRGKITKEFDFREGRAKWDITGRVSNISPSFWINRYASNHFKWENDFQNEFRIDAGTLFSYPVGKLTARFNYAIIDNHIYFGQEALPYQHQGGLSVLSAFLSKDFTAWKFHLTGDLLIQKSSNSDIVDLPLIVTRTAGFFQHNIHFKLTDGYLNTQIGAEIFFSTSYRGYSYMPSTGIYYLDPAASVGGYPFINAFINFKLKRTRIFLVFDHLNSGLTGTNYFLVPDYPMNIRMFRYGLAWTFYD